MFSKFFRGKRVKIPGYTASMVAETVTPIKAAGVFVETSILRIKFKGHLRPLVVRVEQALVLEKDSVSFIFQGGIVRVEKGPVLSKQTAPDPRFHPLEDKAAQKAALTTLTRLGGSVPGAS